MIYQSSSSRETKEIGGSLARLLDARGAHQTRATIIALSGELGAGKTIFTKGFLRACGVRAEVTSPTFVLVKSYKLSRGPFQKIYHLDCYRIHDVKELAHLGFEEIITNPRHLVLIEWPEQIKKALPKKMLWVRMRHGKKETRRTIGITI